MPTHDDANLILRLFELRREERMRAARGWFVQKFSPATLEEADKLCPPGSEENVSLRMVGSYWEMVASFLNSGVLDKELFYKSGNELLFIYLRLSRVIPTFRETYKDPTVYAEMEQAATEMIAWKKARSAEGFEAFRARVLGA